ncbi:MAG: SCO family protein [Burkholderiaceae bacterium]
MNTEITKRRALGIIAAAGAGALLAACSESKPQFKAIDITGADYARNFRLADHEGRERTIADFKGKAVVVFFGFTQCPDVCPTTLSELAEVKKMLGKDGKRLQAVFITVDPARDTPEILKAYMGNFDPTFIALVPTPAQLEQVAKDFKVHYKKVEGKTPTSYTMDHSAGSYVYDATGNVRLYTRYGSGAQALADDVKLLLNA